MKHISVVLVVHVEDEIATNYDELVAYLETAIFQEGHLIGSIVATRDVTDQVEARLEKMQKEILDEKVDP